MNRGRRKEDIKAGVKKRSLEITSEEQFKDYWVNREKYSDYSGTLFNDSKLALRCLYLYCEMRDGGLI